MNRTWLRWLPAVVVPVLIAGGALAANATAGTSLPSKSPQQVLELVASSTVTSFSGTVKQSSELGLPELPTMSGDAATSGLASNLELVSGSHTVRVYVDGPKKERVQVLDTLAERDLVRNGTDLWTYDSAKATATHVSLPTKASSESGSESSPSATASPTQLAQKFLANVGPSTDVSLGTNTTVAGRSAYDLVLTPKTKATLIGSVSIAVDSKTGLPLSVDVQARGQKTPAVSVAFSDLSLQTPSADLFTFTPPANTKVTQQSVPTHTKASADRSADHSGQKPTVTGSGWTSIAQLPAGSVPTSASTASILSQLTSPVTNGRLLSTSLVNVLLTDDGRVFAGAVPTSALQAAAAH